VWPKKSVQVHQTAPRLTDGQQSWMVAEAWERKDQQLLHHRYGSEKTKGRWGVEQATCEDNSEGRPWEEVKKQTKAELIYETTRQGLNVYAQYQSIPRVAPFSVAISTWV